MYTKKRSSVRMLKCIQVYIDIHDILSNHETLLFALVLHYCILFLKSGIPYPFYLDRAPRTLEKKKKCEVLIRYSLSVAFDQFD